MLQDLRYAVRQLARRPGFVAVAVLTLALGIGANTAVFSAVYAALLARPPYPDSDQLQVLMPTLTQPSGTVDSMRYWSYPEYEALRDAAPDVTVAAYTPDALSFNLSAAGHPARARVELVSASYFGVLGVRAARGRTFAPGEDAAPDAGTVAVIGDGLWRSAFGRDPGVVGRTVTLNGVQLTVVGIMPAGFTGLSGEADVWVPITMAPTLVFRNRLRQQLSFWHSVVARVPRAEAPLAAAELAAAARTMSSRIPFTDAFGSVRVAVASRPLAAVGVDRSLGRALLILLGAVGCVLLIACVNLANLLLASGVRRSRELGLRVALGASRRRLARQLLTESAVLGALGGGAAVLVAWGGLLLARTLRPAALAPGTLQGLGLSIPVLAFNVSVAILAALAFGAAPAFAATRKDPRDLLGSAGADRRRSGPRAALVATEVALAAVLLIGAGLLVRSLGHLRATPPGFRPDHVFTAWVNVPRQGYSGQEATSLFMQTTRRLQARPGVERAAVANCLPAHVKAVAGGGGCDHVQMHIQGETADRQGREVWLDMVSAGYFAAMGIPIVEGRGVAERDREGAPRVAVVTQAAADRYWPGRDPVGQRIQLSVWDPSEGWAEVVGVVGDVVGQSLREAARPGVYLAFPQFSYRSNYLVARTEGDPHAIAGVARSVIGELDPELPLWDVRTMEERLNRVTARDRFSAVLLGAFGGLALLLAAIGIYGVLGYAVATRTREMGLRMAIGARRGDVVHLVVAEGLRFTLVGLGVGLVLAGALSRLLESQLYQVSPLDPAAFASAALILLVTATLACWVPARRATRIDPMEALRHE
ncbi:MAG: ABC transporter permease [Candidatus Palauibacterales bacterium]|nr:ABC transporter permease [Candidatus Palauibacterales bacterium]